MSTAIPEDNPELVAARAAGAAVLHRGDLLGELSRMKRTIAVGGTHGKTTTSSMVALALLAAGREPAYLVGGELRAAGTNAAWGAGEWAVIEADESDRSFLKLGREVAVVTNVELDHHATYATLAELELAFQEFAAPAELRVLGPGVELPGRGREVHFGIGEGGVRAEGVELHPGGSRFRVDGVEIALRVPGRHNVLNALAALAACREAGRRGRRRRAGAGRLHGGGAPLRGARPHRRGRARGRRLRAPSDGGPRHARGRPDARAAPARGLLPAPPLLAHAHARPRVRGARSRWPTSWWCWTSIPRASAPRTSPA